MSALEPVPALSPEGIMIAHSELMRTILLLLALRGVIDRPNLENMIEEVRGGIQERGYDKRFTADADRHVRDLLAQLRNQLDAIERLSRENERPQ
jgi:hypothetical protein